MEELKRAIQAAGEELLNTHEWSLDDDHRKPVIETLFGQVVLKHVALVIDPAAVEMARKAKIAALRTELAALESANMGVERSMEDSEDMSPAELAEEIKRLANDLADAHVRLARLDRASSAMWVQVRSYAVEKIESELHAAIDKLAAAGTSTRQA